MDFFLAQFEPLVGTDFTVQTSQGPFTLKLVEAVEHPRRGLPEHLRTPLSLIFDGPPDVVLAHDSYQIAHPELGTHVLDMAPVLPGAGAPGRGPQYQILFS
ncbi:hypothetical protein SOM61_09995 [Massilia sp. CFBP9012]|uniref:DUF6916 family protein n=1 Tax=Massilia sp. CFBP9012 TaxID=3096531 RepID=UPI002A6B1594|nr:hypothetical protein [Massilia sp. CFBP9012]MDY0975296.1 hypothetical protein [Massilia sp. CFBP9012]